MAHLYILSKKEKHPVGDPLNCGENIAGSFQIEKWSGVCPRKIYGSNHFII